MVNLIESIIAIPIPFNMIVLVVLICSVAGVITAIAKEVRKYLCHREEVDFKRDLLASGMSAADIERTIQAHSPNRRPGDHRHSEVLS